MMRSSRLLALSLLLAAAGACSPGPRMDDLGTGGSAPSGGAEPGAGGSDSSGGTSSGGVSGGASGGASTSGSGGAGTTGGWTGGSSGAPSGGSNGAGGSPPQGGDPKFVIFLLLGQSNMEGMPQPQSQDLAENPRIKVLAYDNCADQGREYGEWYPATPPLHSCGGGVGPGDYFAKTLISSLPGDFTIGLVPLGVNGAPIDVFSKGVPRNSHYLPPDDHWETGYEWIISRAERAQEDGVIRGLLFHHGESNFGQTTWVDKVKALATDLRTDLSLGDVPFLAGELYYNGCCASHNALVAQVAAELSSAYVVTAEDLNGVDQYHFDLAGQRQLGARYGEAMQDLNLVW